jgi:integrase
VRKPYYLEKRDTWMVWLNGKQEKLGRGLTEEQAWDKYRELQGFRGTLRPASPILLVFEAFLEDVKVNQAPGTYDWYNNFLSAFTRCHRTLLLSDLAPHHVTRWANKHFPNDSTRHGAMRAVQRALNWAVDQKLIAISPIAKLKKPTPNRREKLISPDLWKKIMKGEPIKRWRDFFNFMRETGCRVQEARIIEASQFDPKHNRFVIPANKAKGKKVPRVIYCNPEALKIIKRKMVEHPDGALFRSRTGKPLTRNAIRCRFRKYGDGLCATLIRHTFITEALIKGHDCVSVAALCGHDPATLAKTYQKLSQNPRYLGDLAKKVRA